MGQCQSSSPNDPAMVDSSLQYSLDLLEAASVNQKKTQGRRRRRSSGCSCGDKHNHECHSTALTASTTSSKSKPEEEDEHRPVPSVTIKRKTSNCCSETQRWRRTHKTTPPSGSPRDLMDGCSLSASTRRSCTSASSNSSKLHSRRELLKAKELACKAAHPNWEQERLQSSAGVLVHAHWKVTAPQGSARST